MSTQRPFRSPLLVVLAAFSAPLQALPQDSAASPAPMQKVEISGQGAASVRRDDTAARIVVGREEIARYGDSNLSALLKRQPGITMTGGEVRMRGLGAGYTQILLNGDPVPAGFSIDSLAPATIERIDILRSGTADLGSQAIAGTINIILKKSTGSQRGLKLGAALPGRRPDPAATLNWSDRRGQLAYSLVAEAAQLKENQRFTNNDTENLNRRGSDEVVNPRTTRLNLAPRLNWTGAEGGVLAWQGFFDLTNQINRGGSHETLFAGQGTSYPDSGFFLDADSVSARSDVNWSQRLGAEGKLTAKAGVNHFKRSTHYAFDGHGPGGASLLRQVDSEAVDDNLVFSGKYLTPFRSAHNLALGWEGGRSQRREARLQDDAIDQGPPHPVLDEDYLAVVTRLAVFVQDEWAITARLQAYFGVRWEGLRTETGGRTLDTVHSRSSVPSPILQLLWKLPGSEKDQLRLNIARTYKAPSLRSLIPRRYTINNGNSATNPDFRGNPALRPELAWGVDLAYESYFAKDSSASVSAYARRIDQVTTQTLYMEDGLWMQTPFNNGKAKVAGIEFDTRFNLTPALDLRANAARNWSRLDAVPGPHNRLDQQARISANLGVDYRLGAGQTVGMNLNLQFGGPAQLSAQVSSETGPVRTLDLYALWKLDGGRRLRLSATNVLHPARNSSRSYLDAELRSRRTTSAASSAALRLVFETNL